MKKFSFILVFGILIGLFSATYLFAGEIDLLVKKLVEKGVITNGEAQQILTETKEEMRVKMEQGELDTLPKWIQKMKFKGDIRVRYENKDKTARQDQNRARVRMRYGFVAKPTNKIEVGFRAASGSNEQTSTNQTMTSSFSSKSLWLDRAYVKYRPLTEYDFTLIGGKMALPFYRAQKSDLIWDGDINPEGGAFQISYPLGGLKGFLNGGYFAMYESSSSSDETSLGALQTGFEGKLPNKGKYKLGVAYYDFHNIKDADINVISPGNDTDTNTNDGGILTYDYNLVDLQGEVKLPWRLSILSQELPITLYGNYVTNVADDVTEDNGYLAGVKFGKAKKKGSWQAGYNYRKLEKDASVGFLCDSDFHGGGTDSKGHKFNLAYALDDNSTIGLTFLKAKEISGSKNQYDTMQLDWKTKF